MSPCHFISWPEPPPGLSPRPPPVLSLPGTGFPAFLNSDTASQIICTAYHLLENSQSERHFLWPACCYFLFITDSSSQTQDTSIIRPLPPFMKHTPNPRPIDPKMKRQKATEIGGRVFHVFSGHCVVSINDTITLFYFIILFYIICNSILNVRA